VACGGPTSTRTRTDQGRVAPHPPQPAHLPAHSSTHACTRLPSMNTSCARCAHGSLFSAPPRRRCASLHLNNYSFSQVPIRGTRLLCQEWPAPKCLHVFERITVLPKPCAQHCSTYSAQCIAAAAPGMVPGSAWSRLLCALTTSRHVFPPSHPILPPQPLSHSFPYFADTAALPPLPAPFVSLHCDHLPCMTPYCCPFASSQYIPHLDLPEGASIFAPPLITMEPQ